MTLHFYPVLLPSCCLEIYKGIVDIQQTLHQAQKRQPERGNISHAPLQRLVVMSLSST